jgi:hypothetical protein
VVGVHATDPASAFMGQWARLRAPDVGVIERALYDERSIVRMLGMRRTMFVLPIESAPVVHAACTRAIADRERTLLIRLLEGAGIATDGARWLHPVEEATLIAIEERGEALAADLTKAVPDLREQIVFGEGKKWAGKVGVSTRVLLLLAADGRIVRGRPRGTWTSSQHRWAPMTAWAPDGIDGLATADARVELVRRWLRSFGPGTVKDLKWWTGLTLGEVRRALTEVESVEVELDGGGTGLMLADDLDEVAAPDPWVALLPSLDSTPMGWTERDWYLGDHRPVLFDRSGNVGPTIWSDGRVVGGWAQRKDGEIRLRFLEDVGAEVVRASEAEAERLAAWLGAVRVTPRFPTPLDKELRA